MTPKTNLDLVGPALSPEIQLLVVFEEGHVAPLDAVSRVYDP